ncbi:MAG: hypothetical protein Q8P56_02195 [Candidatus Uhrbacteria bacterium]|nr:hypothetical protein [Candidatus Uhrbacteria bacterium]
MNRNSVQFKQKMVAIGWLGLVVFALHTSIFFLSSEHMAVVAPCAGVSNAVCPILQQDIMGAALLIPRLSQPEIPRAINTAFYSISVLSVVFFVLSLFVSAWQHIRKRNYLYGLFHRYRQAFSRGTIHSKVYA